MPQKPANKGLGAFSLAFDRMMLTERLNALPECQPVDFWHSNSLSISSPNPKLAFMAFHFTADNMLNKNQYTWKAKAIGDNPKIVGPIDSDYLNRSEGYEVLPFIIRFAEQHSWTYRHNGQSAVPGILEGQNIERMIHFCPAGKHTHEYVRQWILNNWTAYIK